jgi:nitrite reductase/ring-hydroxylating ferredoxin subunit
MAQEYKLKGISSLDLKPGEKREVEVEGVEEGKVLLCNVGGNITAVGNRCTHYGAPLVKGVLTGDGRITCPWHGGLFIPAPVVLDRC